MFTFENWKDILWHAKNDKMDAAIQRTDLPLLRFFLVCASHLHNESIAKRADA
jgi:hypothetical protein